MAAMEKKVTQQFGALFLEYSRAHLQAMIEARVAGNIEKRAARPGFLVPRAEHQTRNARQPQRPGAHRAGLQRDVQRDAVETPSVQVLCSFPQSENFGVCRRVAVAFAAIVAATDDAILENADGADGNVGRSTEGGRWMRNVEAFARFFDCFMHPEFVVHHAGFVEEMR